MSHQEHLDAAADSLGVVIDATGIFADWRRHLLLNDEKKPRAILANVATALRHAPELRDMLGFDTFAGETMMLRPAPWIEERPNWEPHPWTDTDDVRLTEWLQRQGIFIRDRDVALAVQLVAAENSYNPPKDYLDGLHWDGESRIEALLPTIFGAESSRYVQSVFRCFLIGSVARVYAPGCKMDTMLVLEGPQGIRKSTAVRELYGEPHSTDDIPEFGTKDAAITVGSAWCIEVAELSAMVGQRKQLESVKAFITRRVDNYRPVFGRRNVKRPRHCVLVGTTNADDWVRDDTGARRFWPVRCGEIDIDLLQANRDQLWAEAVALYGLGPEGGGAWWFTDPTLLEDAKMQQEARHAPDVWERLVLEYVAAKRETTGEQVLMECLSVSKSDLKTADQMRVAAILRRAGWHRVRVWKRGQVWFAPDYLASNREEGRLE